jgi:hypothetical protein
MEAGQVDDKMLMIIELATIVEERALFPIEQVTSAEHRLRNLCGKVPTLEQVAQWTSTELVYNLAARVVDERVRVAKETSEELGENSACHLCGGYRDHNDLDYMFGLAKMISKQTHVAGAVATLALNALTVPLGAFVAAVPGSSSRAYIKRCRLLMCGVCGNQRKGNFWNNHEMKVSQADCAKHPSWQRLAQAGYTTFLDHRKLAQYH